MHTNPLVFYAEQGLMSDPGKHTSWFSDLPDAIPSLCKVVQGLLIHEGWAGQYGVSMPNDRAQESGTRMVSEKMDLIQQLDKRALIESRPPAKRLFSVCRDFALLLTAMLRHKGIPARVRFGFATYFNPPNIEVGYGEHVVTEYWHAQDQRWVLVDAQLDEINARQFEYRSIPVMFPGMCI